MCGKIEKCVSQVWRCHTLQFPALKELREEDEFRLPGARARQTLSKEKRGGSGVWATVSDTVLERGGVSLSMASTAAM